MADFALIWKTGYVTKDGEEIGNYELIVEGFTEAFSRPWKRSIEYHNASAFE